MTDPKASGVIGAAEVVAAVDPMVWERVITDDCKVLDPYRSLLGW